MGYREFIGLGLKLLFNSDIKIPHLKEANS